MAFSVKSKILLTVLSVVLMFTFFILFYFPARQEQVLLDNYNEEIENFANSVALGVKIALTEQNFEGVATAIDFVRDDNRLQFVSIIQIDTVLDSAHDSFSLNKTVFRTFPEGAEVDVNATSNESFIYKTAAFSTPIMTGEVMLSFSTQEIVESMAQIRQTSIIASLIVFGIGLGIGYLLARNISGPVLALRDAAKKVGEGDLSQSVNSNSNDEIGELAIAFNRMVRELKIEASIDKIRNRTVAMQQSKEWEMVVDALFEQMRKLELNAEGFRILIRDANKKDWHYWVARDETDSPTNHYISEDPVFQKLHTAAKNDNQSYLTAELSADDGSYFKTIANEPDAEDAAISADKRPLIISTAFTKYGALQTYGREALSSENETLLQRLATIIDQSFIRYLDLKKSEKQALEAVKQASLERIRGEVASMRSKNDLNKVTPLVWRELTTLEVPFTRCGVFIMDEEDKSILCFLSSPGGKALGLFTMHIDDTEITTNIFNAWKEAKVYTDHWDEQAFMRWTEKLIEMGHIENPTNYQGAARPPESLHLHFVPFKQGMLYVGNNEPLSEDHIDLVTSLAKVFSVAFARYEDFNKLEKAKNELESTLSELKETQSQLVLSEKMASLGELTAGIAHEIQNPLNFVNNFSELSTELIEEMKEEIEHEHHEEVQFLAGNLKKNLEKINHHGKRASSIVQGMLEHSRDGHSQKEPTDINAIVEEYMRLAYHGFRAKDKSFNANLSMDLDESLPKVNVVAQDISRVLLNLINNALYAVSEKAKKNTDYEPTVFVRTEEVNRRVEIRIRDNGEGIPEQVVDKIFQPFFTTKPTGKGTGLGLSISYDIVTKGHNGSLAVTTNTTKSESSETGTEFTMSIPIN